MQPLQGLTALVDLRLKSQFRLAAVFDIRASMLSGAHQLKCLQLSASVWEADVIAGKTKLQHLHVPGSVLIGGAAAEAQLLSHLQHMQQLTHLDMTSALRRMDDGKLAAAAYSALTASSNLQLLSVSGCTMPEGVWQHLFPAGGQLPHLRSLNISGVRTLPPGADVFVYAPAPEGSRLVSCCPGLTHLNMRNLHHSTGLLIGLQGLSKLHTLCVGDDVLPADNWQALCQLTGLRELRVSCSAHAYVAEEALLQLTRLKHLTALNIPGSEKGLEQEISLFCEVSWSMAERCLLLSVHVCVLLPDSLTA
jgi:hypothetical protein